MNLHLTAATGSAAIHTGKEETMSNDNWNPQGDGKYTVLDDEPQYVPVVAEAQHQQPGPAPLAGGIPKGGVFHG